MNHSEFENDSELSLLNTITLRSQTDGADRAPEINAAIRKLCGQGGGTLRLEGGLFLSTTIRLASHVSLYVAGDAELRALPGCDDEEEREYSPLAFMVDQSQTSQSPYLEPDNFMTKQDFGHSYFHNALLVGDGVEDVKITGPGRINGDGALTKLNTVMDHPLGQRADKLISLKQCRWVEIGGISVGKDLWYSETDAPNEDEPFYLDASGGNDGQGISNMLHLAEGGHFALLCTGCEDVYVHDLYAEKGDQVRDILDFMESSHVRCENIYAQGADDVIKLGSDCALVRPLPCRDIRIRNIIGDTACNLFQIGSETAGDIEDIWVDNLYVLGSDKVGFSISCNDGGAVRNVFLNCRGTHPRRSVMKRCRCPFFLSITGRGRTVGARDGGKNIPLGHIENVVLKGVDVSDCYAGSMAKRPGPTRWQPFTDQPRTPSLIVGCPGRDIKNITLEDIHVLSKGGNPPEDGRNTPPELLPGQFNLRHMAGDDRASLIPAHGLYARHVNNLRLIDCIFTTEMPDGREDVVICSN